MTSREDIVAALATVPGIAASPTQPEVVAPGMAWPVWRSTAWANQVPGGVREASWYAVVALPDPSREATVAEADPIVETIGDALIAAELGVLSVAPTTVAVSNGDPIPALRYTLGDRS